MSPCVRTEFVMRPLPEKAPPKRRVPSEGEMSPGARKLTRLFQTFLFDMFNTAFEHAVRSLEPLLVPYIIERQPARAASPAGGPIEAVLSAALQDLRTARVCDAVCLQFFSQVVSYINTILLNTLLKSSHHCTCGTGIQVKLAISRIEEWLQREPAIAPARFRLEQIREAANFLVMDKAFLQDEAATHAAMNKLSPGQIYTLAKSFHSDEYARKMDDALLRAARTRVVGEVDVDCLCEDPKAFIDLS
eukprot:m51a1_g8657 putative dil domain containing protein (247) ;mRNA; f:65404-66336